MCTVDGCQKKTFRSNVCAMHYFRKRRNGGVDILKRKREGQRGQARKSGYNPFVWKGRNPTANAA